jgi:hypothetical protein
MMLGLHGSGLASTTCVFDVGVERGVWLVGVGLAHCWVLKHQAPRSSASAWVVGVWWFWFLPLLCCAGWVWWGVGGVVV